MGFLERLVRVLARAGIALAAAATLASMAVIGYSVFMRYFLNLPTPWVDELVGYLLVAAVMLAAADALFHGEHIAVDVLTERLSDRGRRLSALLGCAAVFATAVLLAWEGVEMVAFSRMVGLRSNGYLAVPMWVPQFVVPLGAALLALAALVTIAVAWRDRRGRAADAAGASAPRDV
ncbi:MAG: TRAP transporter small permease [Burkholderiales bacterium]|nr:TRAP transporter small permease [Burkholderiales bacterium]MCC7113794.1 TRAP transporter small permease [Burkholderiales bacterium]